MVLVIRSTLDHRPINPSVAAFSPDSMVNQLPLNSPYSVMYAVYEQRRDAKDSNVRYGAMTEDEVLTYVLEDAGIKRHEVADGRGPSFHLQEPTFQFSRPKNIVIVLEESLGAEFVGSLGGRPLTPILDAAATQRHLVRSTLCHRHPFGAWNRSRGDRHHPHRTRSVVKLAETQNHFFTLASLLRAQGYQTSFIYGGEAHFDNMKRFFLANGFDTVIDEKDYPDPDYLGTWGVSDEDLFNRADQHFTQAGDQPFFSLVFTSSNHEPFDIPAGRVTPETGPDGPRETAVKYSDYAVGKFLEHAESSAYWDNTVILVIADHNSRVYGDQLVPVDRFHIPGLIVGGGIEPRFVPGISSQIDMLPTLLSLAGVRRNTPPSGAT